MKSRRFIALSVLAVMIFTGTACSDSLPENALSSRPDESVYAVLKLNDTSEFLKWLLSEANINTFMPLILASESSNDIIGGIEMISAFAQNTPLKSAVVLAGVSGKDAKSQEVFMQAAFTVSPELNSIVRNISQGKASAKDIAKLLLGTESPLIALAETMIKVENADDNILRIDNAIFVKAVDDVIILALSEDDVKASVKALEDKKARLSLINARAFSTKDFAMLHVDPKTAEVLDDSGELKELKLSEYMAKPFNLELGFESQPGKFILSSHNNVLESTAKKYAEKIPNVKPVKGDYIDLRNSGGASTPIFAAGGMFNLAGTEEVKDAKDGLDFILGQLKKRFGIAKEDVYALFTGPFSLVINGSVMFESFKIPALYISQTGAKGAASKVYNTLTKSPHFHKIHDGILQVDSSVSPVSCIIGNAGNTLGIAFAELASFSDRPNTEGAFGELMSKNSISSWWIDFAGIQSWLNDDANGVFATLTPIAGIFGFGQILDAVRNVLSADFSVRSMSLSGEDIETVHLEFALKEIRAEDGLFAKLVKVYRDFQ
ncbi:MAG: hypothetical protein IJQ77_08650 [Synergistaceae bacterium]|nr:hypothetical protein [Synergistaceae bacterium]